MNREEFRSWSSGDYTKWLHLVIIAALGRGGETPGFWPIFGLQHWEAETSDGKVVLEVAVDTESGLDREGNVNFSSTAHEFMHTLGLPDLFYLEGNMTISPVGRWSLMDRGFGSGFCDLISGKCESYANGNDTASHIDAWSKLQLGGYQLMR